MGIKKPMTYYPDVVPYPMFHAGDMVEVWDGNNYYYGYVVEFKFFDPFDKFDWYEVRLKISHWYVEMEARADAIRLILRGSVWT